MPLVCEIDIQAYCRPNDVIRPLFIHAPLQCHLIWRFMYSSGRFALHFHPDSSHLTSDWRDIANTAKGPICPQMCEISIQAYCLPNDFIRPWNVHVHSRLSPNLTIYPQLWPIYVALPPSWLPPNVKLTWNRCYSWRTYMPLVCEISLQAYCRPTDVIRRLIIHAPNRMSANVTSYAEFWPICIALPPK
jgi:hypothetical protein